MKNIFQIKKYFYLYIVSLKKIIVLLLFLFETNAQSSSKTTLDMSVYYPSSDTADLIVGALLPIHNSPLYAEDLCGNFQGEDGLLPLEALLFTIDEINQDPDLLPGFKLGVLAVDSCNTPHIALKQSLRFIKGFIASQNAHLQNSEFTCVDGTPPTYANGIYDNVIGIIGGQHSAVSIQMASVLRIFEVPQISYRSTSISLSNADEYPYFLRTVPTDRNQVEVIFEVLRNLNVSYASVVFSNTEYGIGGRDELLRQSKNMKSVCFAMPPLPVKEDNSKREFKKVIQTLAKRDKSNVVVLFADLGSAINLFKAAKELQFKKILWVGSDAWTSHTTKLSEFSDILNGSIGIQPLAKSLPGFKNYFSNLTPRNNLRNPWFKEFWHQYFNCTPTTDPTCYENTLKDDSDFFDIKWLHFVRDAVFAFASALHTLWQQECAGMPGLCPLMTHDGHIHGPKLLRFLKKASFQDISNQTFLFQNSGAGTPRYTIFIYKKRLSQSRSPWKPIANFTYKETYPDLSFINEEIHFPFVPNSVCGIPCKGKEVKKINLEDICCWACIECSEYQILNFTEGFCQICEDCQTPNSNSTQCIEKESQYLAFGDQWAITAMALASIGIITTIFVGIIFWVHIDTPVIKAASRELSYILLSGIFLSFIMTFVIVSPPSPFTCGVTRFFVGFSYTVCYAAILTKTNRISRIFNKNPTKPQKAKYTSPQSQMIIVLFLVSVEVVINVSWLIYYQPEVKKICRLEDHYNILICKGSNDFSYIVGFIYPLALVCICTMYAIKTRKCPGGFNEARYIAFTNYTTCILWLIFVPLYSTVSKEGAVRTVCLVMCLSLGAFVQLGCLFFPKVHIVLFKPEKNTRDSVMSQPKSSSQQKSYERNHHSAPAIVYGNIGGADVQSAAVTSLTSDEEGVKRGSVNLAIPKPEYRSVSNLKN